MRGHARFLREDKQAHYVFQVLENQPNLFAALNALKWREVPVTARTEDRDRGRREVRTIQVIDAPEHVRDLFPYVEQVFLVERQIAEGDQSTYQAVLYVTSLTAELAGPADLLTYVRAHWTIENRVHWVRDVTLGEDELPSFSKVNLRDFAKRLKVTGAQVALCRIQMTDPAS